MIKYKNILLLLSTIVLAFKFYGVLFPKKIPEPNWYCQEIDYLEMDIELCDFRRAGRSPVYQSEYQSFFVNTNYYGGVKAK